VPGSLDPRPALAGDARFDVAIVGAGYTGLWTAYYLARADPTLAIAVIEKEIAGFGASGRNGGWCSGLFAASKSQIAPLYGRDAAAAMHRAVIGSVDEIGRVCDDEAIDAHFHKGGSLGVAFDPVQKVRLLQGVEEDESFGFGASDSRWLEADELATHLSFEGALGAVWAPHCARIHPARLVRGLAEAVERKGVTIFERTQVTQIQAGSLQTTTGSIDADVVVRATEGYGSRMPGQRRQVVPIYTYMVATEPLPEEFWRAAGWQGRECVADGPRGFFYAQRTADDRIAIGGGEYGYPFGSRTSAARDVRPKATEALRRIIARRWPAAAYASLTHSWAAPSGFAGTGSRRWGWKGAWLGRAATPATASRPRTWRAAPWPT
jgi:glycine/D-amino acid oxidase-like deaminating enzyme